MVTISWPCSWMRSSSSTLLSSWSSRHENQTFPSDFTAETRRRFVNGWREAGGPMRKPIAGLPALHEPCRLGGFIEVEGATPEMWGASWWETCRHCLQQRPEAAALLDESK